MQPFSLLLTALFATIAQASFKIKLVNPHNISQPAVYVMLNDNMHTLSPRTLLATNHSQASQFTLNHTTHHLSSFNFSSKAHPNHINLYAGQPLSLPAPVGANYNSSIVVFKQKKDLSKKSVLKCQIKGKKGRLNCRSQERNTWRRCGEFGEYLFLAPRAWKGEKTLGQPSCARGSFEAFAVFD